MRLFGPLILFLLLTGCSSNRQQTPLQTAEKTKALSAHETVEGASNPEPANLLTGKVLERIDADRYSYLRLSTPSGEMWAAVLKAEVQVGDEVSVVNPMPMDGFESKSLNRTFERIVFGTLQHADGEDTEQLMMQAHSGIPDATSLGPIKVDKASGPYGRTVEEVFAQSTDLGDRKVAVRGMVSKVNANILGKTWIHIRDGTGDPETKTNDLVVTSQDNPSVGDTVLAEGVLRTNKNYGMGYVFPVIVEEATVTKE